LDGPKPSAPLSIPPRNPGRVLGGASREQQQERKPAQPMKPPGGESHQAMMPDTAGNLKDDSVKE
ncbi:MAG TPA: hypothetical protein VK458_22710, partial [Myxococcaceae bacterium]|nr:hypothetical protein [Myxococcaceae bacterium]